MTAVRFRKCCAATSMLDLIGTEYTNQALPLPPPPTRLISPACTAGQSPGFPAMRCLHAGKVTCTALFAVRRPTPALDWPARPPRIRLAGTPEATAGEHVSCRLFFSVLFASLASFGGGLPRRARRGSQVQVQVRAYRQVVIEPPSPRGRAHVCACQGAVPPLAHRPFAHGCWTAGVLRCRYYAVWRPYRCCRRLAIRHRLMATAGARYGQGNLPSA